MSGQRNWLISTVVLTTFVLLSCPLPIDHNLLLLVEDEIPPELVIVSPTPNVPYKDTVTVELTLEDSAFQPGDNKGFVRTFTFSILGDVQFARTVTFESDGSYTVSPDRDRLPFDYENDVWTFSFPTEDLVGTIQILTFAAEDLNSNRNVQNITLIEDTNPPYLVLDNPPIAGIYYNEEANVPISGMVSNSSIDFTTSSIKILHWEVQYTSLNGEIDVTKVDQQPDGTYKNGTFTFQPNDSDPSKRGEFSGYIPREDFVGEVGPLTFIFWVEDFRGHRQTTNRTLEDSAKGPSVSFYATNPTLYSHVATPSLRVEGEVDLTNLASMKYTVDQPIGLPQSQNFLPVLPLPYFYFDILPQGTPSLSGTLTVTVQTWDTSGRENSKSYLIYDDPTPPDPPSVSGTSSPTTNKWPSWSWNVPLETEEFRRQLDSQTGNWTYVNVATTTYSATSDYPSGLTDGVHTLYVQARDNLYNWSDSGTYAISVDTTDPAITVNDKYTDDRTPNLTGTVSDNLADPVDVSLHMVITYAVGGGTTYAHDFISNASNWSHNVSDILSTGKYTVTVTATDPAGNQTSAQGSLTVDTTDPSVTVNNKTTTNTTPTINGTVSDNLASSAELDMNIEITPSGGGSPYTSSFIPSGKNWSHTVTTPLSVGTYDIEVTATDPAGNDDADTGTLTVESP
jgi:hypothetical protein